MNSTKDTTKQSDCPGSMEFTFGHRDTAIPGFAMIGFTFMGCCAPLVAWGSGWAALNALDRDPFQIEDVIILSFVAIAWPSGAILALVLGVLHPLFGKTVLSMDSQRIVIRKYLFRFCWKEYSLENDERTVFAISSRVDNRPSFDSSLLRKNNGPITAFCLEARNGSRKIILYDSYDKHRVDQLLNDISRCVQQTRNHAVASTL